MPQEGTQTAQEKQPTSTMTEAGFSLNVKIIDPFGQEVMLTFRAPLVQQADRLLSHYSATVKKLLDEGWQVVGARPSATNGAAADASAPTCQFHGPMKKSNHGNGFYCPKKMGDGSYCKEKAV